MQGIAPTQATIGRISPPPHGAPAGSPHSVRSRGTIAGIGASRGTVAGISSVHGGERAIVPRMSMARLLDRATAAGTSRMRRGRAVAMGALAAASASTQAKKKRLQRLRLCRSQLRGESFRSWMNATLENSTMGQIVDGIQITLSLLLVGLSIWLNWDGPFTAAEPSWMETTELTFSIVFTVEYAARLYAAENRCAYVVSFFALVDLVTVLPVYATLAIVGNANGAEDDISRVRSQFLRPIRVLRALRILRAYRLLAFSTSAIQRQMSVVALTVVSLVVCTTGIIQALEYSDDPDDADGQTLPFLDAMYYIIVTITTVGYGDISPKSETGRITIMVMITATMVLIPSQISKLSQMMAQRSIYGGRVSTTGNKAHVIVCGDVTADSLAHFLREFFHADTALANETAVVLAPREPSFDMKRLIMNSKYDTRVKYLQGSAMLDGDLLRAGADRARAVFCMLDKFSMDPQATDTEATLIAASVRLFNRTVPVSAQVVLSSNVRHVQLSGANSFVCVERFKQGLIAQSTMIPGMCALVSNLVSTVSSANDDELPSTWVSEYFRGSTNELYDAEFPASMQGLSFADAAEILYAEFSAILIAVETCGPVETAQSRGFSSQHAAPVSSRRSRSRRTDRRSGRRARSTASMESTAAFDAGASAASQLLCLPLGYRVIPGDSAILICDHMSIARHVSELSEAKINQYSILLRYFQANCRNSSTADSLAEGSGARSDSKTPQAGTPAPRSSAGDEQKHDRAALLSRIRGVHPSEFSDDIVPPDARHPAGVAEGDFPRRARMTRRSTLRTRNRASWQLHPDQYHLAAEPRTYEDFLRTAPPPMTGHIVVCGRPQDLGDFVLPLRSKLLRKVSPIIIVCPVPPSENSVHKVLQVADLYFVQGSPLSLKVLTSASVLLARSIAILTNPSGTALQRNGERASDDLLQDADAISTLRYVMEVCEKADPQPYIVIELTQDSNIKFLSGIRRQFDHASSSEDESDSNSDESSTTDDEAPGPVKPTQTELSDIVEDSGESDAQLAAGSPLRPPRPPSDPPPPARSRAAGKHPRESQRSPRRAQGRLSMQIGGAVRAQPRSVGVNGGTAVDIEASSQRTSRSMTSYDSIAPEEQVDLGAELEYVRRPTFASGRVAMSNIIDSLIGAAYRKPFMVRCVQVLLMGLRANDVAGRTKPSGGITDVPRLHQIDMPPSFEGEEFARVFGLLLHYRRLLAVSLYRAGASMQSPLPYVYTNPSPSTVLESGDKIFVIGRFADVDAALEAFGIGQ